MEKLDHVQVGTLTVPYMIQFLPFRYCFHTYGNPPIQGVRVTDVEVRDTGTGIVPMYTTYIKL